MHELVDQILEIEQVSGGTDTTERFLRIANKNIDRKHPYHQLS